MGEYLKRYNARRVKDVSLSIVLSLREGRFLVDRYYLPCLVLTTTEREACSSLRFVFATRSSRVHATLFKPRVFFFLRLSLEFSEVSFPFVFHFPFLWLISSFFLFNNSAGSSALRKNDEFLLDNRFRTLQKTHTLHLLLLEGLPNHRYIFFKKKTNIILQTRT